MKILLISERETQRTSRVVQGEHQWRRKNIRGTKHSGDEPGRAGEKKKAATVQKKKTNRKKSAVTNKEKIMTCRKRKRQNGASLTIVGGSSLGKKRGRSRAAAC